MSSIFLPLRKEHWGSHHGQAHSSSSSDWVFTRRHCSDIEKISIEAEIKRTGCSLVVIPEVTVVEYPKGVSF